jgi:asparagine synthase (glutamine-hydrolysing)
LSICLQVHKTDAIAHERLAIIDPESGAQPLFSEDGNIIVAANGEIFNYKELYAGLKTPYKPKTGSDCEVIIPLAASFPVEEYPSMLRGMFSVIVYDKRDGSFSAFRVSQV